MIEVDICAVPDHSEEGGEGPGVLLPTRGDAGVSAQSYCRTQSPQPGDILEVTAPAGDFILMPGPEAQVQAGLVSRG